MGHEDIFITEILAATYAVFTTPKTNRENFSDSIQSIWTEINTDWMQSSDYKYDNRSFDYELYDDNSSGDTDIFCTIWIPVIR